MTEKFISYSNSNYLGKLNFPKSGINIQPTVSKRRLPHLKTDVVNSVVQRLFVRRSLKHAHARNLRKSRATRNEAYLFSVKLATCDSTCQLYYSESFSCDQTTTMNFWGIIQIVLLLMWTTLAYDDRGEVFQLTNPVFQHVHYVGSLQLKGTSRTQYRINVFDIIVLT